MDRLDQINQIYETKSQKGWVSIYSPLLSSLKFYGTGRIAKIVPKDEMQFTIGGTEAGGKVALNDTIRTILESSGFDVLVRHTTSGSRVTGGEYLGINLPTENILLLRVLQLVEGAAINAALIRQ